MSAYIPKKLPIGIQTFEKLRREGWFYVDKTELVYRLTTRGCYYFLSRPRRFGKSLLLSTLRAYYEGKRELFEGLAITRHEELTWEAHPVLYLDLNSQKFESSTALNYVLDQFLGNAEKQYGVPSDGSDNFGPRFCNLIQRVAEKTGKHVVILVDEYDKPMLQTIGHPELQDEFRGTLKVFYSALKTMDAYIQFAFLTGVTKFGKVSVFSDLNHLNDISMDLRYYDLCGISEPELLSCFAEDITELARVNNMSREDCVAELRRRYDGYHFEENAPGMYNPFSVLNTFDKMKFGSYWFETGTPSYLVQLLQQFDTNLEDMAENKTTEDVLNCIDINATNAIPTIYQSGYLTIKDYDKEFRMYTLGFPNDEVEEGFIHYLVPFYTSVKAGGTAFCMQQFVKDVRTGDTEAFIARLRSLFADTPYELVKDLENHYQNVLWLLYKLMGFYTRAEYHTSRGRIDLVVKTPKFIYVMEFKLDGTAEEALAQIEEKNYTLPFAVEEQQIIRIGMNFSRETRNIENYIIG